MLIHTTGIEGQHIFYKLPHCQPFRDHKLKVLLLIPSTDSGVNVYAEAITMLKTHYDKTFHVVAERRQLCQRCQAFDKSMENFSTALLGLAIT